MAGVGKIPSPQTYNGVLWMSWPIRYVPWRAKGQGVCAARAQALPPGRGSSAGGSTLRSPLKGMLRGREKRFSTSCSKVLARSLNCFSSRRSPSRMRAAMRKVKVLAEE